MIVLNLTSAFNLNSGGRRFTIAHELCHIVHDRGRARRVAHVSGPWVAPGVEKRANAFAAMLLMPRSLLLSLQPRAGFRDIGNVMNVAEQLQVNEPALIEHLYNMDFIDDWDRERLKGALRRH